MLIGVEPLHPVDCRDARVIQTWCVNQIEELHLVADGILRDPLDIPASSKKTFLTGQLVQESRLAVTDRSQHHHCRLVWVGSWICLRHDSECKSYFWVLQSVLLKK